jgi:pimeloyl-ACP methyl ester carboxylesterase
MKKWLQFSILIVGLLILSAANRIPGHTLAATQEAGLGTPGPAQIVKIKASDGLEIVGAFYPSALSGRQSPAALLLHQYGGSKEEWKPLIPALQGEGYSILAVDQRGFGETGRGVAWTQAEADVSTLLAWLRTQPPINGDQVAIIGASVGSNLALRGCVNDDRCKVAVALSPGLNYFGVKTTDAVQKMGKRAFLLVAAQSDGEAAHGVKQLGTVAPGNLMIRLYEDSSRHGVDLFLYDDLIPAIVQWLRTYNR